MTTRAAYCGNTDACPAVPSSDLGWILGFFAIANTDECSMALQSFLLRADGSTSSAGPTGGSWAWYNSNIVLMGVTTVLDFPEGILRWVSKSTHRLSEHDVFLTL